MSISGSVDLKWADGTYKFAFGWGEFEMLQSVLDSGPYVTLDRLLRGQWRVGDISHTIRVGLIGGGLIPDKAREMVELYVENRPPLESHPIAVAILAAGLKGAPDEKSGEAEGEAPDSASMTSPTENSGSA
jgi:hypothetical protein